MYTLFDEKCVKASFHNNKQFQELSREGIIVGEMLVIVLANTTNKI